ncbi:hypothetical protein BDB00DRAFT_792304 [Zychaea mexicana]|uniref:uncharacterized protein n=1 Tax=Zychaea mexicana TaxID=64656 RepID=UPI0022FDF345|nr:uncharacterized protein BDB00DRAFT_792304 [Zychaea mexicana]KAI9487931.1 hypothetical protein BDB00DRAFT_792304 [Zychaea mexicana]
MNFQGYSQSTRWAKQQHQQPSTVDTYTQQQQQQQQLDYQQLYHWSSDLCFLSPFNDIGREQLYDDNDESRQPTNHNQSIAMAAPSSPLYSPSSGCHYLDSAGDDGIGFTSLSSTGYFDCLTPDDAAGIAAAAAASSDDDVACKDEAVGRFFGCNHITTEAASWDPEVEDEHRMHHHSNNELSEHQGRDDIVMEEAPLMTSSNDDAYMQLFLNRLSIVSEDAQPCVELFSRCQPTGSPPCEETRNQESETTTKPTNVIIPGSTSLSNLSDFMLFDDNHQQQDININHDGGRMASYWNNSRVPMNHNGSLQEPQLATNVQRTSFVSTTTAPEGHRQQQLPPSRGDQLVRSVLSSNDLPPGRSFAVEGEDGCGELNLCSDQE